MYAVNAPKSLTPIISWYKADLSLGMKRFLSAIILLGIAGLTGCSHQYVMKMSNGSKIVAAGRPKLVQEKGQYVYKDARGDKHYVSQARVIEIEPASDAAQEEPKPKKK